jgi:hypothetical protein
MNTPLQKAGVPDAAGHGLSSKAVHFDLLKKESRLHRAEINTSWKPKGNADRQGVVGQPAIQPTQFES